MKNINQNRKLIHITLLLGIYIAFKKFLEIKWQNTT